IEKRRRKTQEERNKKVSDTFLPASRPNLRWQDIFPKLATAAFFGDNPLVPDQWFSSIDVICAQVAEMMQLCACALLLFVDVACFVVQLGDDAIEDAYAKGREHKQKR
ncbi:hypothetical protein CFAM422_012069, partial [Trichoderma lentiforme]